MNTHKESHLRDVWPDAAIAEAHQETQEANDWFDQMRLTDADVEAMAELDSRRRRPMINYHDL